MEQNKKIEKDRKIEGDRKTEGKRKTEIYDILLQLISVVFWLCIWAVAARIMNNKILFVGPRETLCAFIRIVKNPKVAECIFNSILKIVGGLFIGTLGGVFTATLSYKCRIFKVLLSTGGYVV